MVTKRSWSIIIPIILSVVAISISGITAVHNFFVQEENLRIANNALDISNEAHQAVQPFLKPIINCEEVEIITDMYFYPYNYTEVEFDLVFHFKNYGKGIAKDIEISIYISELAEPQTLFKAINQSTVNDIYPDEDFIWRMGFTFGGYNITVNETELAFIVRTDYLDKTSGSFENQTYWMRYTIGETRYYQLSLEEKNKLLPYYENLILS